MAVARPNGIERLGNLSKLICPELRHFVGLLEIGPACDSAYIIDDAAVWLHEVEAAEDGTIIHQPDWPFPAPTIMVTYDAWNEVLTQVAGSAMAFHEVSAAKVPPVVTLTVSKNDHQANLTIDDLRLAFQRLPEGCDIDFYLRYRPASILRTVFKLRSGAIVGQDSWLADPIVCLLDENRLDFHTFITRFQARGFRSFYLTPDPAGALGQMMAAAAAAADPPEP